ncbi:GNAT family N-acetyltransferase [Pseudomonas fulva]|uniref:GNAT family N-acetyltransferase n=1 Tax=Pseudomonas fulva TaxID=47880 RepID=UPI00201DA34D|nr:GNAT family N-acetyltransferase [Pseudomonas fulva]UQY34407.1 GNAT family N-acetyltransferase [Pseudomonas fulva]
MQANIVSGYLKSYDLARPSDFEEYLSIWRTSQSRRPHDHPGYLMLMKSNNQHPRAVVYFEDDIPRIIYAFYMLYLQDFPSIGLGSVQACHIVSAYGYGGPVFCQLESGASEGFERAFSNYLSENKVISEFVREDLFSTFKVIRPVESIKQQENVVVGLQRTAESLWLDYKHSVRKNIKRAEASELQVELDFEAKTTEEFVEVYHLTMTRTNASQSFMIPESEFVKFNTHLVEDKIGFYVHVRLHGEVIATELVLRSPRHVYSFLGGSNMEYSALRPSDLLKHHVNLWCVSNNIEGYVLGGGVRPYDGIYKFKLAFDQNGSTPFCVQRLIHDRNRYDDAISARRNAAIGASWIENPDYFPAYFS